MILGIDPGIRKLWYALIQEKDILDAGIITFTDKIQNAREDQYERMKHIYDFFNTIFEQHPTIHTVCMERYFFTTYNRNNAEFVYAMRWIVLMLAFQYNKKIKEYTPQEIKKRITGNSKASKQLMKKMIMKLYQLQDLPKYHDAADALWLARLGK